MKLKIKVQLVKLLFMVELIVTECLFQTIFVAFFIIILEHYFSFRDLVKAFNDTYSITFKIRLFIFIPIYLFYYLFDSKRLFKLFPNHLYVFAVGMMISCLLVAMILASINGVIMILLIVAATALNAYLLSKLIVWQTRLLLGEDYIANDLI
ncbi:MAG TPA: hypothetical protein VG367_01745 [Mucilaginibacter sp.]|nr:hypothetical protein [Mucilaginibacter sp.]